MIFQAQGKFYALLLNLIFSFLIHICSHKIVVALIFELDQLVATRLLFLSVGAAIVNMNVYLLIYS